MRLTRRSVLGTVATGSVGLTAGCSASVGTTDLTIRNCLTDTRRVEVAITATADGSTVYDDTHNVPGETCSDAREAPVAVEDIITEAGTYRIRADAAEMDPIEEERTFNEAVVENNDDAIAVYVEEAGLNLN